MRQKILNFAQWGQPGGRRHCILRPEELESLERAHAERSAQPNPQLLHLPYHLAVYRLIIISCPCFLLL